MMLGELLRRLFLRLDPDAVVFLVGIGVILDVVSTILWIRRWKRGHGASGIPIIPWFLYAVATLCSSVPGPVFLGTPHWLYRLYNFLFLSCFHLLLQFLLPWMLIPRAQNEEPHR
jgi:ABC-type multidrug transport system permease subunit